MTRFVQEARSIVSSGRDELSTLDALTEPLRRLVARPDSLADLAPNGDPEPDRSLVIYRAEDLSIFAVVWPAGGATPVHNHNGWAIEGVISGMVRNRNFVRVDDGARSSYAQLEEVAPTTARAGETSALDLPPDDIHSVVTPAGPALTIQVYGFDLITQPRLVFDPLTCSVRSIRSGGFRTGPGPRSIQDWHKVRPSSPA